MKYPTRLLVIAVFLAACGSDSGSGSVVPPQTSNPPSPERPNRNRGSGGSGGTSATSPDAAVAPDAGAVADAGAAVDGGAAGDGAVPDGGDAISSDGLGAGDAAAPTAEATWSHTGCMQAALMYPMIDRNNGRFPPGSCPPPEGLPRSCLGDSKIKVMGATASAFETGYVHPPGYAVDEHMMTRWSSPSGPTAWLALDLGEERTFERIYLAWELAHGSDYDIVVSNDGQSWTKLAEVRGGNGYQDIIDVQGKARHVRINGITRGRTDTGGRVYGYSLFDVVICGERP